MIDAAVEKPAARAWSSSRRCTSRSRWPGWPRRASCCRSCRTSPASTPPSTPRCRRRPRPSPCRGSGGSAGGCAGTASTGCRTPGRRGGRPSWRPARRRVVTCHLGAGASLAAVLDGRSVDTTMGFTPLDGLVMATRSGAVDPGLLLWLEEHEGLRPRRGGRGPRARAPGCWRWPAPPTCGRSWPGTTTTPGWRWTSTCTGWPPASRR